MCAYALTVPRLPRYSPGGNIMMVFTYDGDTWTEPRKLYLQSADGKIPKVIANQLLVHPQTGYLTPTNLLIFNRIRNRRSRTIAQKREML
jgi:hypothetical protein